MLAVGVLVAGGAAPLVTVPIRAEETAHAATLGHPKPAQRPHRRLRPPTLGEKAAKIAVRMAGVPYRWGGESPSGFDCSGLVRWTYLRLGVDLPHSSYALYAVGRRVARSHMKPGDVLFFEGLGHVGLYLGRGKMVHAPRSGLDVEVIRLADSNYGSRFVGARRVASA